MSDYQMWDWQLSAEDVEQTMREAMDHICGQFPDALAEQCVDTVAQACMSHLRALADARQHGIASPDHPVSEWNKASEELKEAWKRTAQDRYNMLHRVRRKAWEAGRDGKPESWLETAP